MSVVIRLLDAGWQTVAAVIVTHAIVIAAGGSGEARCPLGDLGLPRLPAGRTPWNCSPKVLHVGEIVSYRVRIDRRPGGSCVRADLMTVEHRCGASGRAAQHERRRRPFASSISIPPRRGSQFRPTNTSVPPVTGTKAGRAVGAHGRRVRAERGTVQSYRLFARPDRPCSPRSATRDACCRRRRSRPCSESDAS